MRNISNRPILKRIGTPADTDVSTDILNLDGKADTISTAVVTDIPATITTLDGKADTISTAVVTDIPATLGTPTGADIATDLANIQTEVDKIGTPTDTDLSTDLSNLDGKADTISTAVVTDIPATISDLKSDSEEILRYTSAKGINMWYCDTSVVSSGDGTTWATAFKTIQEAEDARGEGDSVLIRPGTYDEDASITGLTIAKDGGAFLSTGESYESVIVRNTNAGATHCINVSGDSNSFKGIKAKETGLIGWEISGKDNQLTRCSTTSSATGILVTSAANSNSLDDCRVAFCTLNGYDLNGTATFISNSVAAVCNNGAVMSSTSVASVLRNVVISDCGATGFHIESGSTLAGLFNCSGSNTVDILDEGAGSSRIVGFNQKSKILDGNSEQEDLKAVYDNSTKLKEFTIDLSQAAGTYDICEADGDILVEQFNTYVSQAGSTFNYATIQTNDDTALFLIDSTDGVVGNLTLGKQIFVNNTQLMMNGKSFRLEDGKKLQYTIDGDTGSGQIKLVLKYREISASATLI